MQTPLVAGHRTHLITQVSQHVEAIVFYQRFVHLMRQTAPQPARVKEVDEALVAVFVASYRRQSERLTHLRLLLSAKGQVNVGERLPRPVLKQVLLLEVLGRDVLFLAERALISAFESLLDGLQCMIDALRHRGCRGHSPFFRQPIIGRGLLPGGERGRPAVARDATANQAQPLAALFLNKLVHELRQAGLRGALKPT